MQCLLHRAKQKTNKDCFQVSRFSHGGFHNLREEYVIVHLRDGVFRVCCWNVVSLSFFYFLSFFFLNPVVFIIQAR